MDSIPRPSIDGNPSIELWHTWSALVIHQLSTCPLPTSEDELSDFIDHIPSLEGIGEFCIRYTYVWLMDYLHIPISH